ncbi:META domain-containing protein [Altererythrobacter indicus]|uniref:META domain-containing protein n=1 Tax=Altericroceibacterium indicum TaxID=374177 RepID=A0A845AFH1_9SPHN|nr:META domain-containing protein [Altericroceibacterium indicum]MXP25898.1 META domain-containing protein [Altericroceibacterium indicum]
MRWSISCVLLLSLSACAIRPSADHQLADTRWRVTELDGEKPVGEKSADLTFSSNSLSANIGCNQIKGEWRVEERRLIAGPFGQTRMECRDIGLFEQEQALQSLLVASPTLTIENGRLTLQSSGHKAVLQQLNRQP